MNYTLSMTLCRIQLLGNNDLLLEFGKCMYKSLYDMFSRKITAARRRQTVAAATRHGGGCWTVLMAVVCSASPAVLWGVSGVYPRPAATMNGDVSSPGECDAALGRNK